MKKYFLSVTILVILSLITTWIIGNKQSKKYKEDFVSYKTAVKEALEGKNINEALEKIEYMSAKDENNYIFNIDRANIYNQKKDYSKAKDEFKKALEINNRLEKDSNFLIVYAKTLLNNKDYEECKRVIAKAKDIGVSEELNNEIKDMLGKIDQGVHDNVK